MPIAQSATDPTPTVTQASTSAAAPVRRLAQVAVALLVAGGIYLYLVRGPAMLFDMASGLGGALCF